MSTNTSSRTTRVYFGLLGVFLTLVLLSCSPAFSPFEPPIKGKATLAETDRVYALVENQVAANDIETTARALGYSPLTPINLDGLSLVMVPVDLPENTTGLEAINALETAVLSSTVGVNHAYRLQQVAGNVTDRRTFANDLLRWPSGGCRAQTAIGLIDGGIDSNAPLLADVDIQMRNFADGSVSARRHGTEVASVLADPSRLKNVSLFSANVVEANETGEDLAGAAQIVQALDWMARQNVSLVNISLAGPKNKLLAQAVNVAQRRGIMLVAAVGNNGPTAPAQFPAALSGVIAVTALNAQERIFRNAVRGPHVDFAAPGVDIFVPSQTGGRYVSGTSIAAPFVTAFLATQTVRNFETLAKSARDLGFVGHDNIFGNGLIQAESGC